jgi:hypothetical protein
MSSYLVQGLLSNTLVAGKTSALRVVVAPWDATAVTAVVVKILRPDGSTLLLTLAGPQVVVLAHGAPNESVAVQIPGSALPSVGLYYFTVQLLTADGAIARTETLDAVSLLPTKDLRMMVSRVWSGVATAKPGEVQAATDAMTRLSFLYPIRDGISTLDGDYSAGLRYNLQNDPEGPPNQDGNIHPLWDQYQHPDPGRDTIDCAMEYRFPDAGEGSGASTHPIYNGWLPNSGAVWDAPLAHVFCHETGHNHGLEPKSDPHLDPTGQGVHSKDQDIAASDVDGGIDIEYMQPFASPTLDIMFPTGGSEPPLQLSLNAWDWEYVRTQLMTRKSTGPQGPGLQWQDLLGHDLRPSPAAARNSDGRLEVFVLGGDRTLYHIAEANVGGPWQEWATLEGHDLKGPVVVVTDRNGVLYVIVQGGDNKLYSRAQTGPSSSTWLPWTTLGGGAVRGFAASSSARGFPAVAAVFEDRKLYVNTAAGGDAWTGWTALDGDELSGPVAIAPNADGRWEAFVVGGDGGVYHRWQVDTNPAIAWHAWTTLIDSRITKSADLRAALGGAGTIAVVLMYPNKSLGCVMQTSPNGLWGVNVDLGGQDLRFPCAINFTADGRLEVAVVGGNQHLYMRWQIDISRPMLWAAWTNMGGHDLQAGPALVDDARQDDEVFIIGGDKALYRGTR